jgi:NDP-sugar pyrophosphorylase family protein
MKAMIFAAGKGTRLQPLTNHLPKALVKINNIPLLEILINKLKHNGFDDIIINIHHFAEQITDFLYKNSNFGINIAISDESSLLLDTGGGLKKASWFFNDNKPFLVHNVDILSDIDLLQLYNFHIQSQSLATLAVMQRNTSRYFLFDKNNKLCGWQNLKNNTIITCNETKQELIPLAFSGIHVISPSIFPLMKEEAVFSITNEYIRLAEEFKISAFNHADSHWIDLGTIENISRAERNFTLYY